MEINITKVCWNIINKCNDKCSFCFRDSIRKPLNVSENKNIIYNLAKSGVKSITFSGGEALLHKGIIDVIKFSHSLGLETTLVTN
jgi:MoaA/NifB/PqqE/SkfB family radical SAM enzyme